MPSTAFDVGTKGPSTVIAGLHVSFTSYLYNGARADLALTSGKVVFEVFSANINAYTAFGVVGVAAPDYSLEVAGRAVTGAMIQGLLGQVYVNDVSVNASSFSIGDAWVMCAVDFTAQKIWFYLPNGWNGDNTSHDPATNLGGFSIAAISGVLPGLYPVVAAWNAPGTFDAKFVGPFVNPVPAGFSAWDPTPPATPTLHAVVNARMAAFTNNFKATSLGLPNVLTWTTVERPDVFAGVIANTVGVTAAVTEAGDTFAGTANFGNTPAFIDLGEVIYVYPPEPRLYVEPDTIHSPFVILSEPKLKVRPFTDS